MLRCRSAKAPQAGVRRIAMTRICANLFLIFVLVSACSSVKVIDRLGLTDVLQGRYMGTKDHFHHFMIPEKETVFWEHVKVPIQNFKVAVEMPYTEDKTKWKRIDVNSISIHIGKTLD